MRPTTIALVLLLGGCGSLGQAVDRGQQAADTAAQANLAILCATTVGAYFRLTNPRQQEGIRLICGSGGIDLVEPEDSVADAQ